MPNMEALKALLEGEAEVDEVSLLEQKYPVTIEVVIVVGKF